MKKNSLKLLAFGLITVAFASCYPEGAEYVDDLDVAISKYDQDFDFNTINTYALPDSVVFIVDGEEAEDFNKDKNDLILGEVENQLNALGWERLYYDEDEKKPDLLVMVSAIETNNAGWYWGSYPPGWDGWWGWWPGWDWWYPGYPGWGWGPWYPVGYNIKSGSVVIEMGEPDAENSEEDIDGVYWGAMNGLLQGSSSYVDNRIKTGINDLFTLHSPFKDLGVETEPYQN
ncbi:DUF4136 domain-containing protein [Marinilabiliaceae bacterium JC017]|nr:DUF4136 domain-containing protein [Marinilabiliaceae bacterium JC017]